MSVESSELKVERSGASRAVFLSYASQDAGAAKRIADALRAAGVEVWFDQNELVGGDAWDAKIRKQIKDCALLIPIISANTQARTEGYFRLEWRLADQRTHLMAKGRPFLLPVVIDGTTDTEAHVPDSFTEVQWTRLPGGEGGSAFAARVQKLLSGELEAGRPRPAERVEAAAPRSSLRLGPWLALVGVAVVVLGLWIARPWQHSGPPAVTPAEKPAAPLSEARKLAARADKLFDRIDNATRSDLDLAERLCRQAVELDPTDGEVRAVYARLLVSYLTLYDQSDERRSAARMHAEQAVKLAPDSDEARLALANFYRLEVPTRPEAERILRALVARRPDHGRAWRILGHTLRYDKRHEESLEVYLRAAALKTRDPLAELNIAQALINLNRVTEAESALDRLIATHPGRTACTIKATLATFRGDFSGAAAALSLVPVDARLDAIYVSAVVRLALWERRPDDALTTLRSFSGDILESAFSIGPKDYWAGLALKMQGRGEAAAALWRSALRAVEQRLATTPTAKTWLAWQALLKDHLGETDEARRLFALVNQMESLGVSHSELRLRVLAARLRGGERGLAIEELTSLGRLTKGSIFQGMFAFDPEFEPLRGEPWFAAALAGSEDHRTAPAALNDKSVAVLAFANLSDDKANEYFSDGISEELLNVLAKVPGLKVSARTSAFYFKGKEVPVPEIAKQLGVAYVVEGSVRKAGDKVRITAQLIKAADGFHVWSDTFTRDLKDVFAVQDEIAGLVAKNLQLKLGQTMDVAAAAEFNPEAFRLYLQGREAWNRRDAAGFQQAELLIHRALELEPRFARAHAALADVWMLGATEPLGGYGQRQSPVLMRIIAKAEQAVAMDGKSAEAHASLGHVLGYAWRSADARRALQRAIELNPNYASAHQWLGRVLLEQGQLDEAIVTLHRAAELDPLSHRILDNYADALECAGRLEEAWAMLGRAATLQPSGVQIRCKQALLLLRLGRRDEALAAARALAADTVADDPDYRLSTAVAVLSACGEAAEAEAALRRIAQDSEDYPIALLNVGRTREFIAHLDYASINWIHNLWFQPEFAAVRAEAGLRAWTGKIGMAEALARAEAWTAAHQARNREGKQ